MILLNFSNMFLLPKIMKNMKSLKCVKYKQNIYFFET